MRIADGKSNCLLLDFGGNIARHGPLDDVKIKPKSGKGGGEAPTKTCANCAAEQPASARTCSECDAEFPPPEKKANAEASLLPVLSTGAIDGKRATSTVHAVGEVMFFVHRKRKGDGPPTVRVDYYAPAGDDARAVPTKIASEWICVEHEGFAGDKAVAWWARHVGTRMPSTVAEAVERLNSGEMPRVVEVETKPDGDYTRVMRLVQEAPRQPGQDDDDESQGKAPELASGVDPWGEDLPF
jgi:DNA repair protein RadD